MRFAMWFMARQFSRLLMFVCFAAFLGSCSFGCFDRALNVQGDGYQERGTVTAIVLGYDRRAHCSGGGSRWNCDWFAEARYTGFGRRYVDDPDPFWVELQRGKVPSWTQNRETLADILPWWVEMGVPWLLIFLLAKVITMTHKQGGRRST